MADEKKDRRIVLSERTPGRMFDIYENPDVADVYADGQGRLMVGPQVTKLELFRTTGIHVENGQLVEQREVFMRLALPTSVFIEAAGNSLAAVGANLAQMDQGAAQLRQTVINSVKMVQDVKLS